jgi:hypothetical protein
MEMMNTIDFNITVGEVFSNYLLPVGFEKFDKQKWVRKCSDEMKQIFILGNSRGVALLPAWGFSFDFVPHLVSRKHVKWHRTPKAAKFDLFYNPLDYTRNVSEWQITLYGEKKDIIEKAEKVATQSVRDARTYWNRVENLHDIPAMFEEWRTREYIRFGFHNYVDAPLAYSFVLARLGRELEAREWLKVYRGSSEIPIETGNVLHQYLEKTFPHGKD